METLAPSWTWRQSCVRIATARATEFVDLTDRLQDVLADAGIDTGFINVQTLHTTTAIVVNEHEPLLLTDFCALLERSAPAVGPYRHDDVGLRAANLVLGERPNGHAHCRALLLNTAVCLNVVAGRVQLGRWQRIFLVELDGPQTREVSLLIAGEGRR